MFQDIRAAAATDFPAVVDRCAVALGLERIVVYLVDLQQRFLVPLAEDQATIGVDSSLAGWAYRTLSLRVEEFPAGILTAWLPLVDGVERLGVLGVRGTALDATYLRRCRIVASLLATVITSTRAYSDSLVRHVRTEAMQLPAEMLRAFLPPRTIGNPQVISTAVLEPAYRLGGDGFDHSLTRTTLHATILDAMGHDLASGLTTSVALAGCRNARRMGSSLQGLVETVDQALTTWLPDQFCTGIMAQLDLASGALRWVNCGHPPPLLIRDQRVLEHALEGRAQPPMGYPGHFLNELRTVHERVLEPGDRVLLYTDGVTEARVADGALFGMERFTDSIIRATASGELPSEALRRLIHSLLDHETSRLSDDATILLIEWKPARPGPG
ncbi:PP2C family protein-serine/threonine phosphatase [Streptomyces sp. H39-S7]|nr:PP2C family protein-serine/threonine phosphatase [Streptomyces sp. H39-S7]MCZ4125575.1 PP2C family protein-serine/threonine phosphatase [Streptomyces sp. H39-S7]